MDFIRVIKLKSILHEDFSDEKEKFFYSLFNNLTVIDRNNCLYFILNKSNQDKELAEHYFHYHKQSGNLWCSRENVLTPFKDKFKMDYACAAKSIKNIINKDIKIGKITSSFKIWD